MQHSNIFLHLFTVLSLRLPSLPSFRLLLLLLSAHGFLLLSSLLSYILFLSCVLFYLDLVAHKLIAPCNGT